MAVQCIIELVLQRTIYPESCLQLYFLKENCHRLMLTSFEEKQAPLASTVFNMLEAYLRAGQEKTPFGVETARRLYRLAAPDRNKHIKSFQNVFALSLKKINDHIDNHPAWSFYKAARVFDPRQLPAIDHGISV